MAFVYNRATNIVGILYRFQEVLNFIQVSISYLSAHMYTWLYQFWLNSIHSLYINKVYIYFIFNLYVLHILYIYM